MRHELHLPIVDALRFHADSCRTAIEVTSRNRAIHDVNDSADRAFCIEQRCGTFDHFNLINIV